MLATPAEFPHASSFAWIRASAPGGESFKVRILENDGRRDPLVAYVGLPPRDPALRRLGAHSMPASGNTRIPLAALAPTADEATAPAPKRHAPRTSAKPRASANPRARRMAR